MNKENESNQNPYEVLKCSFEKLRPAARQRHFDLVCLVSLGVSSMIDLSKMSGNNIQSLHVRLTKLTDRGVFTREKSDRSGRVEFHYSLGHGITVEHLKQFASEQKLLTSMLNVNTKQIQVEDDLCKPNAHKDLLKLLPKLPKFDPRWTDEMKSDWLKSVCYLGTIALS